MDGDVRKASGSVLDRSIVFYEVCQVLRVAHPRRNGVAPIDVRHVAHALPYYVIVWNIADGERGIRAPCELRAVGQFSESGGCAFAVGRASLLLARQG